MPNDMDEAKRIAALLSMAQRQAMIHATPGGTDLFRDFDGRVRRALFSKGLFEHAGGIFSGDPRCMLTEMGLAVRVALLAGTQP